MKRIKRTLFIISFIILVSTISIIQFKDIHSANNSISIHSLIQSNIVYAQDKAVKEDDNRVKSDCDAVLFKVMLVVLIIWLGISLLIFRLDRKITKLEKELHEK